MSNVEGYNLERYTDSVKVVRFATANLGESDEIYEAIQRPLISRTSGALSGFIMSQYKEHNPEWHDQHEVRDIVHAGVRDTQSLLDPYLRKIELKDDALRFLHHERTLHHLAIAAMRTEESLGGFISQTERSTVIQPDAEYLKPVVSLQPQTHGCPAARIGNTQKPSKEFADLSMLSGEVLIEAFAHHGRLR